MAFGIYILRRTEAEREAKRLFDLDMQSLGITDRVDATQPELLAKINEAMREHGLLKDGESCTDYSEGLAQVIAELLRARYG